MREVYSRERQNRGRSLPALVQFFQTPRANECASKVVVFKPSQPLFARTRTLDETCANFRTIISLLRSKDAHREERQRNKESASSNVPGRTPRRCTIDRRNNPSRSRPRRIKRWLNLRPRLRLSRLGTRPSERRFELGRGNPFVRGMYYAFVRVFCEWKF